MNQTVDGIIRPTTFYLESDKINFIGAFKRESYHSFQFIQNKPIQLTSSKQTIEVFLSLKSFLIECLILYLISILIANLILYLTFRNKSKTKLIYKSILETFFGFRKLNFYKKVNDAIHLHWFLLSFAFFQFFVQAIIQNCISSSTVILDTSFLITSIDKILNSKKKLCFCKFNCYYFNCNDL